jgi:ribonuclease-3
MDRDPRRQQQLQSFIQKLGLPATAPVKWSLLHLALIHPSFSQSQNYEQLEFVGDSVVRLIAAEILMEAYPDAPVGEFASIRSMLVSDRILAELSEELGLERYLWVAHHVAKDTAGRQSRLADSLEAVLGALYLSTQTMALIRPWLDEPLQRKAIAIRQDPAHFNYKEILQEWTQAYYKQLPKYTAQLQETATSERDRFEAEVWIGGQKLGMGRGRSKKSAEQAAAKAAYQVLTQEDAPLNTK